MAAYPCNLPGHVDGWMRKQGYHLRRILAAEPDPEVGFTTDEARWRYEMAVLGPKMEFLLLRRRASDSGAKWLQRLGASLPHVRDMLPPLEPAAWRAWGGFKALLNELRGAVDTDVRPDSRAKQLSVAPSTICGLLESGRIPAARAALYGEDIRPHPPPSEEMAEELQAKNPRPDPSRLDTVTEAEWRAAAETISARCAALAEDARVSVDDLLRAARMQRAGAAAGPDGWSGLYLRRLATLFPADVAELMWREYRALADTHDPLLASVVTDATIGGLAKPRGGYRPIAIGRCATRCLMAHLVRRVCPKLRKLLERSHQYALTGVLPAVIRPFIAVGKCAAEGVPWALTDDDFSNAFNAVSQRALFGAVQRIGTVAPELAATMLRTQCMIRDIGWVEMVLRGRYCPDAKRRVIERFARGGGQGCPDMPAAFAEVVAMIEAEAEASMGDVHVGMSAEDACRVLWPLVRRQARLPDGAAPPAEWLAALHRLMGRRRPSPDWSGPHGEASSAYADDTHSGGWAISCIVKSLRRVACAEERATLVADPLKCKVLTSPALKPDLDALLDPLRHRDGAGWEVVTWMRVLGVSLSDPTDRVQFEGAIRETLRVRVVAPADRLIAELEGGAKPAVAYFALTRFVLPNVLYHMQIWGLLCEPDVWSEVDTALSRFCSTLCPSDLRGRLSSSRFRAELALPQELGGLGIPRVALEAPIRAGEQWDRRDAQQAGMLAEHAAVAYHRPPEALDRNRWIPVGTDAYHKAVANSFAEGLEAQAKAELVRRRDRNQLRAAMWAFNAVPWAPDLTIDRVEWDVLWRLTFGGLPPDVARRLDDRVEGHFAVRGRRMEYAVAEAVRESVPPGIVKVWQQPAPEIIPLDHVERCRRANKSPDGWKRADVAFSLITGKTVVVDVRTTNTQSKSARDAGSAGTFMDALAREKVVKSKDYYRDFQPYVVDLGGAVTHKSYMARSSTSPAKSRRPTPRVSTGSATTGLSGLRGGSQSPWSRSPPGLPRECRRHRRHRTATRADGTRIRMPHPRRPQLRRRTATGDDSRECMPVPSCIHLRLSVV